MKMKKIKSKLRIYVANVIVISYLIIKISHKYVNYVKSNFVKGIWKLQNIVVQNYPNNKL